MNSNKSIWHFVISIIFLFITLFVFAFNEENGDFNAVTMYFVVFGLVPVAFGVASNQIIHFSSRFFRESKLEFISYILPSVLFFIVFLLVGKQFKGMIASFSVISTIINGVFYFVDLNKTNS